MNKSKAIAAWVAILTISLALAGCAANADSSASSSETNEAQSSQAASASVLPGQLQSIDYLALVNKLNPLPEGWEDSLETDHFTNTVGDDVEVESKAYAAYLDLKADLEREGVHVDLDSARRSVADQERIMKEFTEEYGADYAKKTVAEPGYSEHHTGLALDLYLIIDGKDVVENQDMMEYPEIWEKIHARLAEYGFILRYLDGCEHITGYGYEPWHIRYIDDSTIAKEIADQGITFEEYKAGKVYPEVSYDFGDSKLYTREELEEAAVQVKCNFAAWDGCELHSLRYAGDDCNTPENVKWLNEIDEGAGYTQVVELIGDFHSPVTEDEPSAWALDTEYTDYQWWLARTGDDGWQLVSSGY
ncbi:MAG: M15 family metallopeptidase [Eggerthellaceae bacterium]|nr:M15 family metallopeptidase [Eggerthellaceae bacterium]